MTLVWSDFYTKHMNMSCGQNVEVLNVKPWGSTNLLLGFEGLTL